MSTWCYYLLTLFLDHMDNLFLAPIQKKPRVIGNSKKSAKASQNIADQEEKDWIQSFSIKSLAIGTQLLGVISSISALKMQIALPNLMIGTCELTDISEPYRNYLEAQQRAEEEGEIDAADFHTLEHLFQVGQYVVCSVKELDVSSLPFKLKVTIDPSVTQTKLKPKDLQRGMLVAAAVKSHEDHGFQLDIGLLGLTGFLPHGDVGEELLPIGRVVLATVQKVKGRVVTVSLVDRPGLVDKPLSNIDSLLPGMLVEAKVQFIYKNGLGVLVMGFDGVIELLHLPALDTPLFELYPIGTTLQARVLVVSITALSKTILLSLLPHVVGLDNITSSFAAYPIGHRFDQVQVLRSERLSGLVCETEACSLKLFAPQKHLDDNPTHYDALKKFKIGTVCPARVLANYGIEGMLKISLAPSVTDESYIMFETLQLGQRVKGTIIAFVPGSGVSVRLSNHVSSAFIPTLHASDTAIQALDMKYKVGQIIHCRVLGLEVDRARVFLTCKKGLLNTNLPLVTSHEDALPNLVTHGIILKVTRSGCLVGFWNKVVGFAPLQQLFSSPSSSKDPTKVFQVGQVIKCTIKASQQNRIIVSFCEPKTTKLAQL
ncbi:rRNA biogenesis protein rrp5 [Massospora cicadina]|nr:rRNA biogenesis protein rrp5 [Massospora cicadina]